MGFRILLLCALCSHSLWPSTAVAQAPTVSRPSTASQDHNQAAPGPPVLDLIALDKDGRPVADLKPEELRLFENKGEVKIKSLSPAAREPSPSDCSSM